MSAVLIFVYDCGFEVSIPVSHAERRELAPLMEAVADKRHERECSTCHVSSDTDFSRSDLPPHIGA